MNDQHEGEPESVIRPIESLLSKSEKAQQRIAPASWQHKMLEANIHALRVALDLLSGGESGPYSIEELQAARAAAEDMYNRTTDAMSKFSTGSSQHTLLRNRTTSLAAAKALIESRLPGASA